MILLQNNETGSIVQLGKGHTTQRGKRAYRVYGINNEWCIPLHILLKRYTQL